MSEQLRIVSTSANVSQEPGSSAVGHEASHYDLSLKLSRRASLPELQAIAGLWRDRRRDDGPRIYQEHDRFVLVVKGIPVEDLLLYYRRVRDMLLNDVPAVAAAIKQDERETRQKLRDALEAMKDDIAARAPGE